MLTLGQFIFWLKLPPNAGFGIKNLKTISGGDTSVRGGDPLSHPLPAWLHAVRGGASSLVAGTYCGSRKPFPQIKIYHWDYTPVSEHPAQASRIMQI